MLHQGRGSADRRELVSAWSGHSGHQRSLRRSASPGPRRRPRPAGGLGGPG
jgi:hypothetical protein